MKKALAAVITAAACFAPTLASAQAAAAKPEPDYTFTGNMTIATDYRFHRHFPDVRWRHLLGSDHSGRRRLRV